MSYEYDVFLSYRRNPWWSKVVHILHRQIEERLQFDLGGEMQVRVFRDQTGVDIGTEYPQELGRKLAASKTFVPILWPEYFAPGRHWCKAELEQMVARRNAMRAQGIGTSLIFPVKIHEFVPKQEIGDIQTLDVSRRITPLMTMSSWDSQRLWKELEPLTIALERTIRDPPPYDPEWATMAVEDFEALFTMEQKEQRHLPTLGGAA